MKNIVASVIEVWGVKNWKGNQNGKFGRGAMTKNSERGTREKSERRGKGRLRMRVREERFRYLSMFNMGVAVLGVLIFPLVAGKAVVKPPANLFPNVPEFLRPPIPDQVKAVLESGSHLLDEDSDPEVRPGLFQGDMALTSEAYNYWRVGLRWDVFPERLWKNGTVPYVISPLYDPTDHVTIYTAIQILNHMTCIKFVPWNGKRKDFLLIWPIKFPKGCWSFVGRTGGAQIVSLQPPDRHGPNCLGGTGRAIHELLHALGIFHEQSRSDRDKFVKVHFDNIIPDRAVDHLMIKEPGLPTITARHEGARLGQRRALSKTDCLKINELYGCLKKSAAASRRYHTICNILGI
ncbi:hypothetical protein J437_LFUL013918 [Ladona fulva]|uniref:Metalloendopeptidase n=1 Tax=Ladona fulva TaxID=123851 RepID=A0A8K0KHY3_LADFU|nr:hypothetical protein J437_LFUL013918 [Ladona fulva]